MPPKTYLESQSTMEPLLTRTREFQDGVPVRVCPLPDDLVSFLPWACAQFDPCIFIKVIREFQSEYTTVVKDSHASRKSKVKSKSSMSFTGLLGKKENDEQKASDRKLTENKSKVSSNEFEWNGKLCYAIKAVYSGRENKLVQLKIEKLSTIPRLIFQILNLIVEFYPCLASILVNRGLDQYIIYEISKLLLVSNITELCFDGSVVPQGHFHVLLDQPNLLNHLSLARCDIDDEIVSMLASKLHFPLPASKTLMILNLSANLITDKGAAHLAEALRTNRKLCYLSLAGNMLTDDGAKSILNTLMVFKITDEEYQERREECIAYYRKREKIIQEFFVELKERAKANKLMSRSNIAKSLKLKASSPKLKASRSSVRPRLDLTPLEELLAYEKAKEMALQKIGSFKHPFHKDNLIITEAGELLCLGNNALCGLNLSYNNITKRALSYFVRVLETQKIQCRRPVGLITIKVEGNPIAEQCEELKKIAILLESALNNHEDKHSPSMKKRTPK